MIPTLEFCRYTFLTFNRLCFSGKLNEPVFVLSKARSFVGQCMKTKEGVFSIKVSISFDLLQEDWEDVIIHEMIHYYIMSNKLHDTSSHGKLFVQLMDSINRQFGRHITISHRSQPSQVVKKTASCHAIAVVHFVDGRTGIKVLPRIVQTIIRYFNIYSQDVNVENVRLFLGKHDFFEKFPSSGALKAYIISDLKQLHEALSKADELIVNGKSLIVKRKK